MRIFIWAGGLVLSLFGTSLVSAQERAAQRALDSLRAKYHLPALLAAIIEPGQIRYVYAGVKRRGQPALMSLGDYFHIGSDTKGVTSLLAGKLVDQGNIILDSELLDVVPALRGQMLPAYAHVTLDELLAHRAGIRPYTTGLEYDHLPIFTGSATAKRLQFARVILQEAPVIPAAGQIFTYSNAGYVLAALMRSRLATALGKSWWLRHLAGCACTTCLAFPIGSMPGSPGATGSKNPPTACSPR